MLQWQSRLMICSSRFWSGEVERGRERIRKGGVRKEEGVRRDKSEGTSL